MECAVVLKWGWGVSKNGTRSVPTPLDPRVGVNVALGWKRTMWAHSVCCGIGLGWGVIKNGTRSVPTTLEPVWGKCCLGLESNEVGTLRVLWYWVGSGGY